MTRSARAGIAVWLTAVVVTAGLLAVRPAPAAGQARQAQPPAQTRQVGRPLDPADAMTPDRMDRIVNRVKWAIVAAVALVVLGPALLWALGALAAVLAVLPFAVVGGMFELLDEARRDMKCAGTRSPSSWPSRSSSRSAAASTTPSPGGRPARPAPTAAPPAGRLTRYDPGDGVANAAERRTSGRLADRRDQPADADADTFAALSTFVVLAFWVLVAGFMAWVIWNALVGPVRWRQRRN